MFTSKQSVVTYGNNYMSFSLSSAGLVHFAAGIISQFIWAGAAVCKRSVCCLVGRCMGDVIPYGGRVLMEPRRVIG